MQLIPSDMKSQTDFDLRKSARSSINGDYVRFICRGCGKVAIGLDGDTDHAEIVDVCKFCKE